MVAQNKPSNLPADSSTALISRRVALPMVAALALLVVPGCNSETNETPAVAMLTRLPKTQETLTALKFSNGIMDQGQYEAAFIRLVNSLNSDLENNFGVKGLTQFNKFDQLKIQPTIDAALAHGLIVAYAPTRSAAGGGFSIETTIKVIGQQPLSFQLPTARVLPNIDISDVRYLPFVTVAATSGAMNPVGTVVNFQGAPAVLIDEAQVRKNASSAGISESALLTDVVANEVGHFVLAKFLWQNNPPREQRLGQVRVQGEASPRSVVQIEEAFSDYYTLAHGSGTMAYQILVLDTKEQVEQYALSNQIFKRGLNKAVTAYSNELRRHGASENLTLRELASLLHHNSALQALHPDIQAIITAEYKAFFDANLMAIKTQVEKLGK